MGRPSSCVGSLFVLSSAWFLGCGPSTPDVAPVADDACVLARGSRTRDTLTVALGSPVDLQHAPIPRSPAEQLLFRHLYQTLIRVDCHGLVTPGLAESWETHEDNRIWSFTLRPDAAFWDGSPVRAESVRDGWLMHEHDGVAPWADSVSGSVTVTNERQLTVRLRRPYEGVPRVFADPTLAVTRHVARPAGPLGTGTYHVAESTEGEIRVVPLGAVSGDELPVLRFIDVGDDPRDAIDLGADLLVSRDPIVVDYIETVEQTEARPLPWDLIYVLATPLRTATDADVGEGLALAELLGLGTVSAESRLPEGPVWWADFGACRLMSSLSAPPQAGDIAGHIVYRRNDPDGRAVAERLVALAASGGLPGVTAARERLTAVGLSDDRFASALSDGRELGFVVAVPRQVLDPCAMIAPMQRAMPWVTAADLDRVLIPLVETRGRAIMRRGSGSVLVDWDGTPLLAVAVGR